MASDFDIGLPLEFSRVHRWVIIESWPEYLILKHSDRRNKIRNAGFRARQVFREHWDGAPWGNITHRDLFILTSIMTEDITIYHDREGKNGTRRKVCLKLKRTYQCLKCPAAKEARANTLGLKWKSVIVFSYQAKRPPFSAHMLSEQE